MIWSLLKPDFLELLLFIISSSNFLCHNFFFLFLQKLSLIKLQFEQVLFLVFLFRLFRILLHFIFRSQLQFCILQIHNFSVISLTQTVLIYLELRVGKYETPVLQNKNFFSYLEKQEVFQELSLKLSRSLEINSLVHPKVFWSFFHQIVFLLSSFSESSVYPNLFKFWVKSRTSAVLRKYFPFSLNL